MVVVVDRFAVCTCVVIVTAVAAIRMCIVCNGCGSGGLVGGI